MLRAGATQDHAGNARVSHAFELRRHGVDHARQARAAGRRDGVVLGESQHPLLGRRFHLGSHVAGGPGDVALRLLLGVGL